MRRYLLDAAAATIGLLVVEWLDRRRDRARYFLLDDEDADYPGERVLLSCSSCDPDRLWTGGRVAA